MNDVLDYFMCCVTALFFILSNIFCQALAAESSNGRTNPPTSLLSSQSFVVYDGTLYRNKPSLLRWGIKPVNILYVSSFWNDWDKAPRDQLPDRKNVRKLAMAARAKGDLVVIDIEHWPLFRRDRSVIADNLQKYITVIGWFRHEAPELKIGFFGILPVADYARSQKGIGSSEYKQWQTENDQLKPLADVVDVIFPSLYTYYPDQRAWGKYAAENIREAHRYGKPVIVFLWPQYSETNIVLSHQYVPVDYWGLQLEIVRRYSDGVVIWGGWGKDGPADWVDNAPWWKVTKEFMQRLGNQ